MMLSAGSMSARASSGSRPRSSSVDPLISANSAVTVLRSPSVASEASGCAEVKRISVLVGVIGVEINAAGARASASAAPHSPQNLSPGWLEVPQLAHVVIKAAPQAAQNLRPSRLSLPHLEQRMFPLMSD